MGRGTFFNFLFFLILNHLFYFSVLGILYSLKTLQYNRNRHINTLCLCINKYFQSLLLIFSSNYPTKLTALREHFTLDWWFKNKLKTNMKTKNFPLSGQMFFMKVSSSNTFGLNSGWTRMVASCLVQWFSYRDLVETVPLLCTAPQSPRKEP